MRVKRIWPAALLAAALLIPAPAASAKGANLDLLKSEVATIIKGTGAWVALSWTATGGDVADVTMTVESRTDGVAVTYPQNTADHTSFWDNDSLVDGEIDYTAFYLDVPEATSGQEAKIRIHVQMTVDGKREKDKFDVKVPIVAHTGADLEQVTNNVGSIAAGQTRWVEVAFTGMAPSTQNVSAVVSAPGLAIIYPAEGASTSLHHDAELSYGETDVVRFLVDAAAANPGIYEVGLDTTYDGGSLAGVVTLEVTG